MKRRLSHMSIKHYVLSAAICLSLAGCQAGRNPADGAGPSTERGVSEGRTDYLAAVEKKMKVMDAKIDELAAESRSMKDDAKAQADRVLVSLREERAALGRQYRRAEALQPGCLGGGESPFWQRMGPDAVVPGKRAGQVQLNREWARPGLQSMVQC